MYTFRARIFVAIYCLIGVTGALYYKMTLVALLFFAGLFFIIIGYYLNGPVYLAVRRIRAGQFDKAVRLLDEVRRPEWLTRFQRSYFYFAKGAVAQHKKDWVLAKACFQEALDIGMRSENDQVAVLINLSVIAHNEGQEQQAFALLENAKLLKHKPYLSEQIKKLEKIYHGSKS